MQSGGGLKFCQVTWKSRKCNDGACFLLVFSQSSSPPFYTIFPEVAYSCTMNMKTEESSETLVPT